VRAGVREGLSRDWIKLARPLTVSLFRPKPGDPVWDAVSPVEQFHGGRRTIQEDWYIGLCPEHYHAQLGFVPPESLNLWIA
jgi:CRISPR-associated endonuclease/helicase Cas3